MSHISCTKKYEDFNCWKCSEPLSNPEEFSKQVIEESPFNKKRTDPEPSKMNIESLKKNEEEVEHLSDSEAIKKKKIDETNFSLIKSKSHNPNSNPNPNPNINEKNQFKGKFKNLSAKSAEYLENLASKLEARYSNSFNFSSSKNYLSDKYDRTKAREKFKFSLQIVLLYGIEELKESKNLQHFNLPQIQGKSFNFNEEEAINNFCREIATKIECSFYEKFKSSSEYTNKLRSLYTNLLNVQNQELRFGILSEAIKPEVLPTYNHNNLANQELKKQREEREKKYLKEECLLRNDNEKKFIMISQKGISVVDLEKEKEFNNFQGEFLKDIANNNNFYQGPSNENENKDDEDVIKEIAQEGMMQRNLFLDSKDLKFTKDSKNSKDNKEKKELRGLASNTDINSPKLLMKSQSKDSSKNINYDEKYLPVILTSKMFT